MSRELVVEPLAFISSGIIFDHMTHFDFLLCRAPT